MSIGIIEYRLHKDSSWIGQEFNTPEEKVEYLKELRSNGYSIDKVIDYEVEARNKQINNYYEWLMN